MMIYQIRGLDSGVLSTRFSETHSNRSTVASFLKVNSRVAPDPFGERMENRDPSGIHSRRLARRDSYEDDFSGASRRENRPKQQSTKSN